MTGHSAGPSVRTPRPNMLRPAREWQMTAIDTVPGPVGAALWRPVPGTPPVWPEASDRSWISWPPSVTPSRETTGLTRRLT
jgi:hypothetical protein